MIAFIISMIIGVICIHLTERKVKKIFLRELKVEKLPPWANQLTTWMAITFPVGAFVLVLGFLQLLLDFLLLLIL